MNPDPESNCCPPTSCDPTCLPQCSSATNVRIKAERAVKPQLVCSIKNCNIFGGHDRNPLPDNQCQKKLNKIKDENKNSLGSPIGLVASNVNFKTEGKTNDIIQARYATYLKAFARLHLNEEIFWDPLIIDDIMKEGLTLYSNSQNKEENNVESSSDIYTQNELNILREFELSGFTFHVELMPELKLNTSASIEIGANGDTVALTLEDFKAAMKSFFRQHKYALITVGSFYALIWRSKEAYFVFDACGRRVSDFQADKEKGVAMLICLSSLENVRHLLVNLSGLQITDALCIRQIKVVKVVTPAGGIMQLDYAARSHQYQVVNDDYAYLRSGLHLTLNRRDLLRNRSALPVAITAIVASKIDHPATWDMKMLDKIICFGVNFCQNFWAKCRINEVVDISEFPTYFTMGQFQITIELEAHKYQGTWRCVPGFKHSELAYTLKKAFDSGDQKLIIQINYQIYAVWKKHDFIYLLDPYRHRILGKAFESEVYEQMEKTASVRMFRSFEVFMNVFNHILLDSNRTSMFFIHGLKVKNIQMKLRPKEANLRPIEDIKLDANGEIMSLNEHICFEEAEDLCQKALAEISDYEDEDLKSDIVEIELRTSSSEAEDLLEEEEAGAGEVEEIEGLETSSSGEEGGGHKKKSGATGGKGGGASRKGGKSKGGKGKKGGTSKSKKSQDASDSVGGAGGKKRKKNKEFEEGEESSEDEGKSGRMKKKTKDIDDKEEKDKKLKKQSKNKDDVEDDKELKDKGERDKDHKDKDLKDKELKDQYQKDKDKKDKDMKDKELSEKALKDKELKDKELKEKDLKDKELKEKQLKDKELKEKQLKDKELKEKELKDKELKEKELKDKELKEKELKDKELNEKELKDKQLKDKELKDKDLKDIKTLKDSEQKKSEEQDKTKDKNITNLGQYKDRQLQDKNVNKDESNGSKDISKDKNNKERKSLGSEQTEDEKTKDKHDKDEAKNFKGDLATGSDKENAAKKDFSKILDKDKDHDKYKGRDLDKDKDKSRKEQFVRDLEQQKSIKTKAKRRSHRYDDDGTEADDENEECFKKKRHYCSLPNPNRYPGYLKYPVDMVIVGSEDGSYTSICKLFQAGFKVADRLLIMTPWGNFVIFRCHGKMATEERNYYLFDGCTCNFERFRHLDLSVGTAGLLCFKHIHNVIEYIRHLRKTRRSERKESKYTADEICQEYCSKSLCNLRL